MFGVFLWVSVLAYASSAALGSPSHVICYFNLAIPINNEQHIGSPIAYNISSNTDLCSCLDNVAHVRSKARQLVMKARD